MRILNFGIKKKFVLIPEPHGGGTCHCHFRILHPLLRNALVQNCDITCRLFVAYVGSFPPLPRYLPLMRFSTYVGLFYPSLGTFGDRTRASRTCTYSTTLQFYIYLHVFRARFDSCNELPPPAIPAPGRCPNVSIRYC